MSARRQRIRGFSLVELGVTMAIMAILAVIVIPSYSEHIRKTRRTEAMSALLDLANRMERYYSDQGTYTGATVAGLRGGDQSENGHYTLSVSALAADSYSVQAAPTSTFQSGDKCGNYTLTSAGEQGVSGSGMTAADCW